MIARICVYCGSSRGGDRVYADAARELAAVLVNNSIELVYGGATKGTMGILADAVLERGGVVHGVIPKLLEEKEIAHTGVTELHVVSSMHERKSMMAALSDGFIALPGGFGTLEELIEMVTWGQLQFHEKPCGVLNINGYFDKLLEFLDHMQEEQFLSAENRAIILADTSAAALLRRFDTYTPPTQEKWL
ncbi:MAG: TIGR00730 family Rossman fold protein [Woeseiaceae bacterium]|nr:TIGR00730 family Rossman fold protein [Woeseiaceae bacterium]NIP21857.1 TIGR00730 family Rossman fold protein [Woeseiaceae bacterium]NIS90942.1 TIGR00730 family Rossman fold protein [Woeseiaceae bacterium]